MVGALGVTADGDEVFVLDVEFDQLAEFLVAQGWSTTPRTDRQVTE